MTTEQRLEDYQNKIIIFYKQHSRMPSYSELQNLTHYRSKGGVAKLVDKLQSRYFLQRDHTGRLIPGYNFLSLPFPGTVQAGFPSPADQGYEDLNRIDLYEFLVRKPADTFVHKVTGDSMVDIGINEGDLLVSERTTSADVGQIVIAEINGSCSVKRLRLDDSGVRYLQSENSEHANIYSEADQTIQILAVVRAVIKQFAGQSV